MIAMKRAAVLLPVIIVCAAACSDSRPREASPSRWTLAPGSASLARDETLRAQIFRALDAAEHAGTDPSISKFKVRCATIVGSPQAERVILGGNSEYAVPEAIHGETSIMNHAITLLGADAARGSVRFLAFYADTCGGGGSCGDCRDYLIQTTRYRDLIVACGQSKDHTVHLQRFNDSVVPEEAMREVTGAGVPVEKPELARLVDAAQAARRGGVALFTQARQHLGVAALSQSGRVYRSAAADDAAFHYRYPIGGALQQAATEQDYFIKTIVVAGEVGEIPRVSYRDRQYGYEFSSFNRKRGRPPIQLILVTGPDRYRVSTFEEALPYAFSAADFMPEAVERFLRDR